MKACAAFLTVVLACTISAADAAEYQVLIPDPALVPAQTLFAEQSLDLDPLPASHEVFVGDEAVAMADGESAPAGDQGLSSKPPLLEPPLPEAGLPQGVVPRESADVGYSMPESRISASREPYSPFAPAPPEGSYLLAGGWLDRFGQCYENYKECHDVPITLSAWHWWHINTGGPLPTGYGIPGEEGTYYYGLEYDQEFCGPVGPFDQMGVYADFHFRDSGDPQRPFYSNDTAWLYQGYVWGLMPSGSVVKAGAIWRRFGLDWDGSWWGSTPFYDGFMLSTGWGVSWEDTPLMTDGFKVDRYYQFFFHDYLDYSLVGANPLSVNGSSQQATFIGRWVPTMELSYDETLALGISAMVGEIDNQRQLSLVGLPAVYASYGDQTIAAWAADLTYRRGGFRAFAEVLQAYGKLSPARYVSGGPSNRLTDVLFGLNWTRGPITYRASYSLGFDDNPSGTQTLFVPGVTVALTKNTELYAEYVLQKIRHSGTDRFATYEDGVQLVLHWRF